MRVNANYLAASLFADDLLSYGIDQAVISPGSRSTPLTLALTMHPAFSCYPVIDERSAGFFALGLARALDKPVVLVCTSGTAAAEYYPAVVEAYQQRIPLIVCTADRPEYLVDTGANQTIHQRGMFKNHIRYAFDAGLPSVSKRFIASLRKNLARAIETADHRDRGPVHINFPFEKPFEPDQLTDDMPASAGMFQPVKKKEIRHNRLNVESFSQAERWLHKSKRPLILAGPAAFSDADISAVKAFASRFDIPIVADIGSGLRFTIGDADVIISNYDSIIRRTGIEQMIKPDLVFIFGMTMISAALEKYLKETSCPRVIINEYGDRFDPSENKRAILAGRPYEIIKQFIARPGNRSTNDNSYNEFWRINNRFFESRKALHRSTLDQIDECVLANDITASLPAGSALMFSNSLTYRVFDDFVSARANRIHVYHNRGASGIDGIISSAAGIAAARKGQTYLVIGDTAFFYDINALWLLKRLNMQVTVFLINNGGGRIFDILPVKKYKSVFEEYFTMPVNIDIKKIVEAFSGKYARVSTIKELRRVLKTPCPNAPFKVIDIIIDPLKAEQNREHLRFGN